MEEEPVFAEYLDKDALQKLLEQAMMWAGEYGLKLLATLIVIVVGVYLARKIKRLLGRVLERQNVDPTLRPFLKDITYYILLVAVGITAMGQLGINITSFLAVLGAAGLAIGLALKDSLSNFASGVMLLFFRFFRCGDYVEIAGTSGTVKAIKIFNTELATPDNQKIFVPNASILSSKIINVTANDTRRMDLVIGIGYGDDIAKTKQVLADILAAETRLEAEPKPLIAVNELADSSVNLIVRPWVKTSDYWAVRWDLMEKIKVTFDAEGISIPFPQREVHVIKQD